ncbi:acyltransferase [Marinilactibacillus sp. Marseille-P9653]|uniref:acyltransferase n=1 Tax=Marinilactibacillus sp. Marseille-P9653 TaxID=2866583 RepID=UPI001CE3E6D4|nr:acyltransferase [Marinilactibacillus sp. Marseille-P9653]
MKNKSIRKDLFFWFSKIWIQLVILLITPLVVSLVVGNTLTSTEISKISTRNYFLRTIYELFTDKGIASFIMIFIITFSTIFIFLRNMNKDSLLNDGQNIYMHDQYIRLWIASKLLGYSKLYLVGVSLPLQFKLILEGTFKEYTSESSTTNYVILNGEIIVDDSEMVKKNNEDCPLVLLICDTYDIENEQIVEPYKKYPRVKISSPNTDDGIRYDNPELVVVVRKITQQYISQFPEIIVLATMNPKNSMKIIGDSFAQSGRNGFKKITVLQMGENRKYLDEYIVFEK